MTNATKALRDAREALPDIRAMAASITSAIKSGSATPRKERYKALALVRELAALAALAHQAEHAEAGEALSIGESHFEGWLSCHEPDRTDGRRPKYTKQDMRDAYAAGMAEQFAAAPSQASEPPQQGCVCPACGSALEAVRQSANSMLSADQFDAVRLGDWFCRKCPVDEGACFHYVWDRDLVAATPPASEAPATAGTLPADPEGGASHG